MIPKASLTAGSQESREALRQAAALTFLQDEALAVNIAGVTTDKFVQGARKVYKRAGFSFTDADIREIHNLLRNEVIRRGLGQTRQESVH